MTYHVHNETIVIPENIDAIRAVTGIEKLGALRGKRIAILAHSATIAGEKALVAHQIRLYGLTTRIYWSLPKT
jgi:hypothetical protein